MSQELTATAVLSFVKGSVNVQLGQSNKHFDVAGSNFVQATQSIPTTPVTAINLGGIGTPGWFFIQNNDPTNYVDIYDAVAGNAFLRLKPGEFAIGRFSCAAPAAKANTGAVLIEYLIVEA